MTAQAQAELTAEELLTSTDTNALVQAAFKRITARDFAAARPIVERALTLAPDNAIAAHAQVHIDTDAGTTEPGAAYMRAFLATHDPAEGINVHNSWHLAQLEVELARPKAALEWHARVVGPNVPKYTMTFYSAVSLLWRLHVYGSGEGLPWDEMRTAALAITDTSPLNDIARAMAFIATGDEANLATLLDRLRGTGTESINAEVVIPVVLGLRAFWQGGYLTAADLLEPVAPSFGRLSIYWEQLIASEDTLAESQLRSGRFAGAEQSLQRRLAWIDLPRYRYWLGRAQLGLGQKAEALTNLRAARERWQDAEPDSPERVALEALLAAA